ncbi:uncharacterized protein LOC119676524 [Teleopsis dalmanni]|uniref:uncharacterized protein LOC119676524 n=1 Tax=Teleopsis dalmanni TaxID=139649 RepID=UPI0018CE08A2|nr:uncharacterized protein LOC119676524 [Teleopsis dalmanni]
MTYAVPANKGNRFIIYDPKSGRQIDPLQYLPIVLGNKRKPSQATGNIIELPQLWNPCSCTDFVCMCCLGMQFTTAFNNRVCVSLEYNSAQLALELRINYNRRNIATFGFSARNPPPMCIPVLLPFPIYTCLRLYDIRAYAGNVHVCLSLVLNAFWNQLFEFHFDCVRFGLNGIEFVTSTSNGNIDRKDITTTVNTLSLDFTEADSDSIIFTDKYREPTKAEKQKQEEVLVQKGVKRRRFG